MQTQRTVLLLSVISIFLWQIESVESQNKSADKSETFYIPSDLAPPPSTEEVLPKTPFYTESTPSNEVQENVEALKARVDKLESTVEFLKRQVDSLQQKPVNSGQK